MLNDGAGERMHWCGGCCVGGGASTCTVSFEKKKSTPTPQDTSIRPYSLPLMETSSEEELGGEEGGEEEEVEEEVERGRGEGIRSYTLTSTVSLPACMASRGSLASRRVCAEKPACSTHSSAHPSHVFECHP